MTSLNKTFPSALKATMRKGGQKKVWNVRTSAFGYTKARMSSFRFFMNIAPIARCSEVTRKRNCMLLNFSFAKEDHAHGGQTRVIGTHCYFPGLRKRMIDLFGEFVAVGSCCCDQFKEFRGRQISKLAEHSTRFAERVF